MIYLSTLISLNIFNLIGLVRAGFGCATSASPLKAVGRCRGGS